jgi:hypothetical protein
MFDAKDWSVQNRFSGAIAKWLALNDFELVGEDTG